MSISVAVTDVEIYRAKDKTKLWAMDFCTKEEITSENLIYIKNIYPHPRCKSLMMDDTGKIYVEMRI